MKNIFLVFNWLLELYNNWLLELNNNWLLELYNLRFILNELILDTISNSLIPFPPQPDVVALRLFILRIPLD